MTRLLVTGGAGFIGSTLALAWKRDHPADEVVALDNLKRRGSELAPARLAAGGVRFAHGDIRSRDDLAAVGGFDSLIECSAEPSVLAGLDGEVAYLLDANLGGTLNCLEAARRAGADLLFLSTSRIYPIPALKALPLAERGSRLALEGSGLGWSTAGIAEGFPLHPGPRSLYGATKLASELVIEEYRESYGMRIAVDRCGVVAGPWQMGKVDQGFAALWAARHLWGERLAYRGFGGRGLQVRDLLHVEDLYELVALQLADMDRHGKATWNVGGGVANSVSLAELTEICRAHAERRIEIAPDLAESPVDIPWYVTDARAVQAATGWAPRRGLERLFADLFAWLRAEAAQLRPVLA